MKEWGRFHPGPAMRACRFTGHILVWLCARVGNKNYGVQVHRGPEISTVREYLTYRSTATLFTITDPTETKCKFVPMETEQQFIELCIES